jgi:hypothetical protein
MPVNIRSDRNFNQFIILNFSFINTSLFQESEEKAFGKVFIAMHRNYQSFTGRCVVIQMVATVGTFKIKAFLFQ